MNEPMNVCYEEFIKAVEHFDFIPDWETADEVIKAVINTLASQMDEPHARIFSQNLPEPLKFNRLFSYQSTPEMMPISDFVNEIATQFDFSREQAQRVIDAVLHVAKATISDEDLEEIEDHLGWSWGMLLERA